jgi:mRNA-degrading endonuclease toxin of MazEF toxin-antitoxin module
LKFPEPVPGLIIRYSYLWRAEYLRGQEEGVKDRPCAIVLSSVEEEGVRRVVVLPITHTAPKEPGAAIEIPAMVKERLGLDGRLIDYASIRQAEVLVEKARAIAGAG